VCFAALFIFCNGAWAEPEVSAKAAVVMDFKTGQVLYEKEPSMRMYPASTTKILTALVVLQNTRPEDRVKASNKVVNTEGSAIWLKEGEELTVSDALYALLLNSANDVAEALAEKTGGSAEGFAAMMNRAAKACGATDSNFNNPHGLPDEGHYTTALDMAGITRVALGNRLFREIVATKTMNITRASEQDLNLLINTNKLLWRYEGAIGVKTGYTIEARQCLVAAAERNGRRLIAVLLGSEGGVWDEAAALLDYGFSAYRLVELVKAGEVVGHFPVEKGVDLVQVKPSRSFWYNIPAGKDPLLLPKWRLKIKPATAPVEQGKCIGELIFSDEQGEIGRVALVAGNSVAKRSLWPLISTILITVSVVFICLKLLTAGVRRRRSLSFRR
jgi:D-alanyl-D-alanine carboxypeptidase (penicillin-binding protein 5/6)